MQRSRIHKGPKSRKKDIVKTSRSLAAKRGWKTREHNKRSRAAKRGWKKRQQQKELFSKKKTGYKKLTKKYKKHKKHKTQKTEHNLFGNLCDFETRAGLYEQLEEDYSNIIKSLPPRQSSRIRVQAIIGDIPKNKIRKLTREEREDRGFRRFLQLDKVNDFLFKYPRIWETDELCQYKKEIQIVEIPRDIRRGKVTVYKRYFYDATDEDETEL